MSSIKLKHSGGNGVIIAAPSSNPASDKTLTLPSDVDGTIVSKDSANSLQNVTGINGGQLSNRNLVINGAMQVAQRGTSSTTNGYGSIDRFRIVYSGTDEAPTQAQADVAAGTTPYTLGFRKCYKITNGDQSNNAGAADFIKIQHRIEAQDIANSGWDYKSASSFLTLSFWVKSSVPQNFYGYLETHGNSPGYLYPYETGSLSQNTWTKVTKTIAGNSNLLFNNDNAEGLRIEIHPFLGTDSTASGVSLNQWNVYASASRTPDQTATWYETNDATFEITGVQLEVGSVATDFEHRSFGQELALCQRYFYKTYDYATAPGTATFVGAQHGRNFDPNAARSSVPICLNFPVRMRAVPTLTWYAGDGQSGKYSTGSTVGGTDLTDEKSVGTSIDESETGIYHANFTEDVPAANLYAFHVLASAEL
jgi:hypothetical protein